MSLCTSFDCSGKDVHRRTAFSKQAECWRDSRCAPQYQAPALHCQRSVTVSESSYTCSRDGLIRPLWQILPKLLLPARSSRISILVVVDVLSLNDMQRLSGITVVYVLIPLTIFKILVRVLQSRTMCHGQSVCILCRLVTRIRHETFYLPIVRTLLFAVRPIDGFPSSWRANERCGLERQLCTEPADFSLRGVSRGPKSTKMESGTLDFRTKVTSLQARYEGN